MNLQTFHQTFETYLSSNYSLTDIEFENVPYTPTKGRPFIDPTIVNTKSLSIMSGDGSKTRYEGKLRFYVYTPLRSGSRESYIIADTLIDLLERNRIAPDLTTRQAQIYPANPVGEFHRLVVEIPYILN